MEKLNLREAGGTQTEIKTKQHNRGWNRPIDRTEEEAVIREESIPGGLEIVGIRTNS